VPNDWFLDAVLPWASDLDPAGSAKIYVPEDDQLPKTLEFVNSAGHHVAVMWVDDEGVVSAELVRGRVLSCSSLPIKMRFRMADQDFWEKIEEFIRSGQ
jgi:hypothetical protein